MAEDPDAARILREREQRRAAELARISEERQERELELSRLRRLGIEGDDDLSDEWEDSVTPPKPRRATSWSEPGQGVDEQKEGSSSQGPESVPRPIGGAFRPPALTSFLHADSTERFDIQFLNTLRFPGFIEAAQGDPDLLRAIVHQAVTLMERAKQELDDPNSAGAFLREAVHRWYRESPTEAEWAARMPDQWAGLFADSRISGGKLAPWLNVRLWSLYEVASRARPLHQRLRRGLSREKKVDSFVSRTPAQQIRAEVSQAILDDLASRRRETEDPVPLVRLSELAVRREVATINDALALLFNAPESGPFVLLHPNRYPDCEEVQLRPPTAGATGAALAYSLAFGRGGRKSTARGRTASESGVGATRSGEEALAAEDEEELDATTIWEATDVPPTAWQRILKEQRRERRRLDSPPKDCRTSEAYSVLRNLVLEDASFRKEFLAVKWRGRPSGLPLLATLLQKGVLAPEVATDHEYLEAELGDLVQGDPQWHPSDGVWTTAGWSITREGTHQEGFRFTAKRTTGAD